MVTNDPTTDPEYPQLNASDDPDSDYYNTVYDSGFQDGYSIGRYEHLLAQDAKQN